MTKLSTVEARDNFSDVINRAAYGKERVVLTRRGKELVAVVPMEDIAILQALEDKLDLEEAKAALKEAGERGTKSWAKLKSELGI